MRNTLHFVAPFSCNFDGSLYRFRSSVHRKNHIVTEHFGDKFSKSREDIVIESSATESQSLSLLGQNLDEFWVAVTLVHGRVCRKKIEVVLSFLYHCH